MELVGDGTQLVEAELNPLVLESTSGVETSDNEIQLKKKLEYIILVWSIIQ